MRLLRALYFCSERERGEASRDKIIHAFGNLAALAPGPAVRLVSNFVMCCIAYYQSQKGMKSGSSNARILYVSSIVSKLVAKVCEKYNSSTGCKYTERNCAKYFCFQRHILMSPIVFFS